MAITNVLLDTVVIIFTLLSLIADFYVAFKVEDPATSRAMRILYRRVCLVLLNYLVPYLIKNVYGLRWLCYGMKR